MSAPWSALGAAAVALAVVELDDSAVGQWMFSRPIVIGPVAGAVFGQPGLGTALGAICELFCLEGLPVGGSLPVSGAVASSASLLLALGSDAWPPELAFPAGLAFGWLYRFVDSALRRGRARLGPIIDARLAAGRRPGFGAVAVYELAKKAAATLSLLALVLVLRAAVGREWLFLPGQVMEGLRLAFGLSPCIGLARAFHAFKVLR